MSIEKGYYGCLGTGEDTRDYLGAEITFPKAPNKYSGIQYNQKEVSLVSCTVHSAYGAYSDVTGYKFTLEERKAIWNKAIELGANPDKGWWVQSAAKLIADTKGDVAYYRVNLGQDDFEDAIKKGYSVMTGFKGNLKEYNADYKEDGVLDLTKISFSSYAHSIRLADGDTEDTYNILIDNYYGSRPQYNVYSIPKENFKELVANEVFFPSGYIYITKNTMEPSSWSKDAWNWATAEGITNGERPKDEITREESVVMLKRLYDKLNI